MYSIYRITNCVNGKTYIGQHKYQKSPYDNYMGSGTMLHRAYKKYRIKNFKKDILVFGIIDKKLIDMMEKEYIFLERKCNTSGCYNITDGGEGGRAIGHATSKETRRKISEAHKGKKRGHFSEEWRRKIAEANKGREVPWKGKHWKLVNGKRVWC